VIVEAAYIGGEEDGAALLQSLRDLGPAMDTFATIPVEELRHLHMDPSQPVPGAGDGLQPRRRDAGDLGRARRRGRALLGVAPRIGRAAPARGRRRRASTEHGAVGTIDAGFVCFATGIAAGEEMKRFVEARVTALRAALGPWTADRGNFNFANSPRGGESLFPPDTYRGLQWVKAAYDPTDLFRASHPIRPATRR
jgi:hypothetical protein